MKIIILLILTTLTLQAQPSNNGTAGSIVEVAWSPGNPSVLSSYNIFEGTNTGVYFTNYTSTATNYTFTNLTRGVTYYFAVQATAPGTLPSTLSLEASCTTLSISAQPTNLHVIVITP